MPTGYLVPDEDADGHGDHGDADQRYEPRPLWNVSRKEDSGLVFGYIHIQGSLAIHFLSKF
jgi:hypothetical protein